MKVVPFLFLLLLAACQPHISGPDWAVSAPANTVFGISATHDRLKDPLFTAFLRPFPMQERALSLFLSKTAHRSGGFRASCYRLGSLPGGKAASCLTQVGGFGDAASLRKAVADAFTQEGIVMVRGIRRPIYVLFDHQKQRMRLLVDGQGRVWLGERSALQSLDSASSINASALRAVEWIAPSASLQGFALASECVEGMEAFAWGLECANADFASQSDAIYQEGHSAQSAYIPTFKNAFHGRGDRPGALNASTFHCRLDLVLTGDREKLHIAKRDIRDLLLMASVSHDGRIQPTDIREGKGRIGLKSILPRRRFEAILARLCPSP